MQARGGQRREPRMPVSVLVLTTISVAMILPYAHVWLHGAASLADLHVGRRAAAGQIPDDFLYVARQSAENRIEAQGLIDAILIAATILALGLAAVALSRWFGARLRVDSAFRAAAASVWVEFAFLAMLYLGSWLIRGADGVRISWTAQVPLDISRLAFSGSLAWLTLRSLTLNALVRCFAFAYFLRRSTAVLSAPDAIVIAGASSALVVVLRVLAELLLS